MAIDISLTMIVPSGPGGLEVLSRCFRQSDVHHRCDDVPNSWASLKGCCLLFADWLCLQLPVPVRKPSCLHQVFIQGLCLLHPPPTLTGHLQHVWNGNMLLSLGTLVRRSCSDLQSNTILSLLAVSSAIRLPRSHPYVFSTKEKDY